MRRLSHPTVAGSCSLVSTRAMRRLSQFLNNRPPATATAPRTDAAIEVVKGGMEFMSVAEDASMHERWQVALTGRVAADVPVEELRELVDLGTPLRQRHVLWPRWWGQPKAGIIESLQAEVSTQSAAQIQLDLKRTLPDPCSDEQREALRRVLCAYAASNPSVGYCQGMSYIAAVPLLMAFSEADAFMALNYIVEEVCPDYHGSSLGGYFRDSAVLDALLRALLPDVHQELVNLGIPFDMLATDHLLTVSARSWPLQAVARLWDVVLMEGSPALLASFLALLMTYFPPALKASQAARTQATEVAADVARRFLELSRNGIANDIDKVIRRTRRFITLLLGDLASTGPCGKTAFLENLRAQFATDNAGSAYQKQGNSELCFEDEAIAGNLVPRSEKDAESTEDSGYGSWELLVEARITLEDGSIQTMEVGLTDQPRDVAAKFVEEHGLDQSYNAPLRNWLKKVEMDAEDYPVKVEGELLQIVEF